MIVLLNNTFQIDDGNRAFDPQTYYEARRFAALLDSYSFSASPQDVIASNSVQGMHLCHHLSFALMEQMVCAFLNRQISINQFMILAGSAMRPSWSNLLCPPTLIRLALQWAVAMGQRLETIAYSRISNNPVAAAAAANALVRTLNNAVNNLRYGHSHTNMSIGKDFDLRLHRGPTLDPILAVSWLYCWFYGGRVLTSESSALLNDWSGFAAARGIVIPTLGGNVRMSESNTQIGQTAGGNALMGSAFPGWDRYTRGSLRYWIPVSFDSLIFLGALFLAWYFGILPGVLMGPLSSRWDRLT